MSLFRQPLRGHYYQTSLSSGQYLCFIFFGSPGLNPGSETPTLTFISHGFLNPAAKLPGQYLIIFFNRAHPQYFSLVSRPVKHPPLVSLLSQTNPARIFQICFLKSHFNIILRSMSGFTKRSLHVFLSIFYIPDHLYATFHTSFLVILIVQGDSKLLAEFLWPVGVEVKAVMNSTPNSNMCYI
jgi:hypothetical protein